MVKNNKTRFFYVLYSDKTWVFDQSERAYYPIYIINENTQSPGYMLYQQCKILLVSGFLNASQVLLNDHGKNLQTTG